MRQGHYSRTSERDDRQSAPPATEIEISVFGGGFGEAICLHVGGEWILIDSCLNPSTQAPASLTYLEEIGVPADAVRLILITHWDDDHIRGIAQMVEECTEATVACSMALQREDVIQFVIEQRHARGSLGSGLDELRTVLGSCRTTGRLVWAKANLPLHPRSAGGNHVVVALSPSDDAVSRSIESLIERATGDSIGFARRYRAPDGPNAASVAATVRADDTSLLLGADLVKANNPLTGWEAVLVHARPDRIATLVKVPHHGSEDAHHERVWDEFVADDAVAIVTPWQLGGGYLPQEADLVRLGQVAGAVYLTAVSTLARAHKDAAVERLVSRTTNVKLKEVRGWGHVRARRGVGQSSWSVHLAGDARKVS
jgi:hypothetical protein